MAVVGVPRGARTRTGRRVRIKADQSQRRPLHSGGRMGSHASSGWGLGSHTPSGRGWGATPPWGGDLGNHTPSGWGWGATPPWGGDLGSHVSLGWGFGEPCPSGRGLGEPRLLVGRGPGMLSVVGGQGHPPLSPPTPSPPEAAAPARLSIVSLSTC